MKSVLVSEKPIMCEKIAKGKKTIIVKKKAPQEVPFRAYIYCCKGNDGYEWLYRVDNNGHGKAQSWHGKVIGEFICDKVEMVNAKCSDYGIDLFYHDCLTNGCLTEREIEKYFNIPKDRDLRVMKGNGYVWNISDLKIYDKPRELSEFGKFGFGHEVPLERPCAPWCYVEDLEEKK